MARLCVSLLCLFALCCVNAVVVDILFPNPNTQSDYCQVAGVVGGSPCTIVWYTPSATMVNISITTAAGEQAGFADAIKINLPTVNITSNITSFTPQIPANTPPGIYIISITSDINTVTSQFYITAELTRITSPSLIVDQWRGGSTRVVTWQRYPANQHQVNIDVTYDGGVSWTSLAIGYTAMPQIFSSVVPQTKYTPYSTVVSAQFTYSWTLPIALAVGSVQLRLTDTQDTAFPLLSVVFLSSAFSTAFTTLTGVWQGTEVRSSSVNGQCVQITCPYVIFSITASQMVQTYPPQSPCTYVEVAVNTPSTTVSRLASASFDGSVLQNDASGSCSRVSLVGKQLIFTTLGNSLVCPAASLETTGCLATDISSVITVNLVSSAYSLLLGKWTGVLQYAVPDVYGGCVTGTCTGVTIEFTDNAVNMVWPLTCAAGVGSISASTVGTQYDGTFYLNPKQYQCTRIVASGNTLYKSQPQASNICLNQDLSTPSCAAGGNMFYETYTRSFGFRTAISFVSVLVVGILALLTLM